jgi:hypothetical protein
VNIHNTTLLEEVNEQGELDRRIKQITYLIRPAFMNSAIFMAPEQKNAWLVYLRIAHPGKLQICFHVISVILSYPHLNFANPS